MKPTRSLLLAVGIALGGCVDPTTSVDSITGLESTELDSSDRPTIVSISAGGTHTCGVWSDGAGYCWGDNGSGQLGDGSTEERLEPTAVAGGIRFAAISAGNTHTCGLTDSGEAYCWGDNPSGELGDGTTQSRLEPVPVTTSLRFESIYAGSNVTCALGRDGSAYCWGDNQYGAVGDGTPTWPNPSTNRNVPTAVVGDHSFVSMSNEVAAMTCGLDEDGWAYCWGYDGSIDYWSSVPWDEISAWAGSTPLTAIAAGGRHRCGLDAEGLAYCWGHNFNGQIGNGIASDEASFTLVAGGLRFSSIVVGLSHSCGLVEGAAYCWGGEPFQSDGDVPHLVDRVATDLVSLDAGLLHNCAIDAQGAGYCWGDNSHGQLGDGSLTSTDLFTPVPLRPRGPPCP